MKKKKQFNKNKVPDLKLSFRLYNVLQRIPKQEF